MSVNDYRLFSLFFDLLLGFWAFVLMLLVCLLLLFIARNQYCKKGFKGTSVAFLYGGMSITMIFMTISFAFFFALPTYVAKVSNSPGQTSGIVEQLRYSSTRGWTSYYMQVDGRAYDISRPWYKELDIGQELSFLTVGDHAFPIGFVNYTVIGMMLTIVVVVGWFFTMFLIVNGLLALFDDPTKYGLLEFLDGITMG